MFPHTRRASNERANESTEDIKIDNSKLAAEDDASNHGRVDETFVNPTVSKAADFLKDFDGCPPITAEESQSVRRKIDWRMMPIMAAMYFMQQLDKSAVSFAAVFDIQGDANLRGTQYAWLTTIVYIGSIIVNRFVCTNYILWSLVMVLMTACTNFAGLVSLRLFLGLFEACIAPTMMILVPMWWTRREQGFRSQWWYLQNGTAGIVGSLLTYAVGLAHDNVLFPYQRIFLTIGLLSCAGAVATWFMLPRDPLHAKFLSREEKRVALERVRYNQTGMQGQKFNWQQVREVFCDPKTYLIMGIILPKAISAGGISAFGPLIIKGFGFDKFQTILLNMVPGAMQIILGLGSGTLMTRFKVWKSVVLLVYVTVSLGGAIGLYVSPRGDEYRAQLMVFYYMLQVSGSMAPIAFAWANANTAGATKKSVIATISWASVCIGNAIGPQIFGEDKPPYYFIGLRSQVISLSIIVGSTGLMVLWLHMLNRRNARLRRQRGSSGTLIDLSTARESEWATLRARQAEADAISGIQRGAADDRGLNDQTDLQNDEFIFTF